MLGSRHPILRSITWTYLDAPAFCHSVLRGRSCSCLFEVYRIQGKQADVVTADASHFYQDARSCAQLQASKAITAPSLNHRARLECPSLPNLTAMEGVAAGAAVEFKAM